MNPIRNAVIGQPADPVKLERARQFRKAMTPAEKHLWRFLRANRLAGMHFRRQQVVRGFIVDFYCHAVALIVEVDGPVHDGQTDADAERDRVLTGIGFRILRFTNDDVFKRTDAVLAGIADACRAD